LIIKFITVMKLIEPLLLPDNKIAQFTLFFKASCRLYLKAHQSQYLTHNTLDYIYKSLSIGVETGGPGEPMPPPPNILVEGAWPNRSAEATGQ